MRLASVVGVAGRTRTPNLPSDGGSAGAASFALLLDRPILVSLCEAAAGAAARPRDGRRKGGYLANQRVALASRAGRALALALGLAASAPTVALALAAVALAAATPTVAVAAPTLAVAALAVALALATVALALALGLAAASPTVALALAAVTLAALAPFCIFT